MAKSKKPVTYDEVFKYLSNNEEKYAEGCTDNRKESLVKVSALRVVSCTISNTKIKVKRLLSSKDSGFQVKADKSKY